MKRLLFSAVLLSSLSAASLHTFGQPAPGEKDKEATPISIKGELIDTACFTASDGGANGKDHAECATKCLGSGIPAAILPEGAKDKKGILFLLTNPKPLAPYAGKTIHVEGTIHEGIAAIDVKQIHVVEADGKMTEIKLDDEHHNMGAEGEKKSDGHKDHRH